MTLGVLTFLAVLARARFARPDLFEQVAAVPDFAIWIAVAAVVNPLIEEVIFRGVYVRPGSRAGDPGQLEIWMPAASATGPVTVGPDS